MVTKSGLSAIERFAFEGDKEYRFTVETLDGKVLVKETLDFFKEVTLFKLLITNAYSI